MEAEKIILLFGESRLIPHVLLGGSRKIHILLFGGSRLIPHVLLGGSRKIHVLMFGGSRLIPVFAWWKQKKITFFCLVEVN